MADVSLAGTFFGLILGILIGTLFAALIIWIVGKLGMGIEVDGFGPAFIAAIFIAVLSNVIIWVWNQLGFGAPAGLVGSIIHLLVTAAILMTAGSYIKGLRVKGFSGAIIASIAIAVVAWLVNWAIGLVT
ncbi:hypothetical protein FTO70_08165 [Methanosarcina sp. KYL-1]|uniref:phage holin family protein n=1 Tax=Methanosarcina sp. KYL-1 TaxID=2602068 RepID=UPI002100736F|nr:phage holin family protein [Methanosarcina sp. KYL-1]MCQ1535652.1 hypothetical protein [Methanosarcina sp. KYL-1]